MPAGPFDRQVTDEPRHTRPESHGDAKPAAEMRASPRHEEEDQRGEETIEEPGYGHGV